MSRRKTALQWLKNTTSISTLRQNWGSWRCSSARETLIPSPCEESAPSEQGGGGNTGGLSPLPPLPPPLLVNSSWAETGRQPWSWTCALLPAGPGGQPISIACLGNPLGGRRPPTPMPEFCKGISRSLHTCVHPDTHIRGSGSLRTLAAVDHYMKTHSSTEDVHCSSLDNWATAFSV